MARARAGRTIRSVHVCAHRTRSRVKTQDWQLGETESRSGAKQKRHFSTSARSSAVNHTTETYSKDVDITPPASQKVHQVDSSTNGPDVQRPTEPLTGEWSRAGAKTKEYETVCCPSTRGFAEVLTSPGFPDQSVRHPAVVRAGGGAEAQVRRYAKGRTLVEQRSESQQARRRPERVESGRS